MGCQHARALLPAGWPQRTIPYHTWRSRLKYHFASHLTQHARRHVACGMREVQWHSDAAFYRCGMLLACVPLPLPAPPMPSVEDASSKGTSAPRDALRACVDTSLRPEQDQLQLSATAKANLVRHACMVHGAACAPRLHAAHPIQRIRLRPSYYPPVG